MEISGVIVVDKPRDWTSHDVVAKLRGICREKRIGHGGTLDPMATGVLPVFIGRATRAAALCESADKEYLAAFRPGIVTDTQDITGTVLERTDRSLAASELESALERFRGVQEQIPPMYSAVKVGGRKLYELARRGIETERQPRTVEISALELVGERDGDYLLRVVCSKGTYVRTLVHDIGQYLGCGAALSNLRRVRAGRFGLDCAHSMNEISDAAEQGLVETLITSVDRLFDDLPAVTATPAEEDRIRNGAPVRSCLKNGRYRVYGTGGEFLMVGAVRDGELRSEKNFFRVTP